MMWQIRKQIHLLLNSDHMLDTGEITILLSELYRKWSLKEPDRMSEISDFFETMRVRLKRESVYDVWDYLKFDADKFTMSMGETYLQQQLPVSSENVVIELLGDLRQTSFDALFEKQLAEIDETLKTDEKKANQLWWTYYADAAVHFREEFICLLCRQTFDSGEKAGKIGRDVSGLVKLMLDTRWADAYPYYVEIAAHPDVPVLTKCMAEVILGQISLYNFPESLVFSQAEKHFTNAKELLPDNLVVRRGWAELYLKKGEVQKARDTFLEVIAKNPADYTTYNFIGDSFVQEHEQQVNGMTPDPVKEQSTGKRSGETEKKPVVGQSEKEQYANKDVAVLEESVAEYEAPAVATEERILLIAEYWYREAILLNPVQSDSYRRLLNLYGNKTWFHKKEKEFPRLMEMMEKTKLYPVPSRFVKKPGKNASCFNDTNLYHACKDGAVQYYSNGDLNNAEAWFKRAIKLQPGLTAAYIEFANARMLEEKYKEAVKILDRAKVSDPECFDIYWTLSELYEKMEMKEAAVAAFEKCLQLRPTWSDWVHNFMGNFYYGLADYDAAISHYNKAIAGNGEYTIYRENLAQAYQLLGSQKENEGAIEEAEKAFLEYGERTATSDAWNYVGNFYYRQKQYSKALPHYTRAISMNDREPVYFENLGLSHEKLEVFEEAERNYRIAAEVNSKDGESLNRLGVFYYNRKDYASAIEFYRKALERQPEEQSFLDNLGLAYEKNGQPDLALEYYKKAAEKEPPDDELFNKIGLIYYKGGKYEEAMEYFRKAAETDKTNSIYIENIASSYRLLGKFANAMKYYRKAIETDPANDNAYNELGRLYYEKGELDNAIDAGKKAIAIKPDYDLYHQNVGFAYKMSGKRKESEEAYRQAIALNSSNYISWNELGNLYYENNEPARALEHYIKAIEIEPADRVLYSNKALALLLMGNASEAAKVMNDTDFGKDFVDSFVQTARGLFPGLLIEQDGNNKLKLSFAGVK